MANQILSGKHAGAHMEDDAEDVVISHPHPPGTAATAPPHIHERRVVVCKADANEIAIGPTGSYTKTHRYKRTEDKDSDGRTIFVEAK